MTSMQPKYMLEPFLDSELMINITNHFVCYFYLTFYNAFRD